MAQNRMIDNDHLSNIYPIVHHYYCIIMYECAGTFLLNFGFPNGSDLYNSDASLINT